MSASRPSVESGDLVVDPSGSVRRKRTLDDPPERPDWDTVITRGAREEDDEGPKRDESTGGGQGGGEVGGGDA